MTNQEAIMILESIQPSCGEKYVFSESKRYEAIEMAINALTAQPEETHDKRTETHSCDCVSRQAVQEIVDRIGGMYPYRQIGNRDSYSQYNKAWTDAINRVGAELNSLPSAQPDNRLSKIAELVEGTIDHFDLDDAMDLLYQIKDVLR